MNWTVVDDIEKLSYLQGRLICAPKYTFDTETTGLQWWKCRIFLMSFCDGQDAWLLPVKHFTKDQLVSFCQAIFSNSKKRVIGQNIKFDLHFIKHEYGVDCSRQMLDTKIMAHLMDENRQNGLKPLCKNLLGIEPLEEAAGKAWLEEHFDTKAEYDYSKVPDEIMYPYSVQDAIMTWKLYKHFEPSIDQYFKDLFETETKLLRYTIEMEQAGVPVDVPYLQGLEAQFTPDMERAKFEFQVVADSIAPQHSTLNIDSHDQLADFLYGALGLRVPFMTKKGKPSVSTDALEQLTHPVIQPLLTYSYANSRLKFVKNLLGYVDGQGLIHANFNTTGTVSGRFSCTDPNLMNQVNDPVILKAFTVAPGEAMFHWDYSLLEMIPMALYSEDQRMLEALREGRDLHRLAGSEIFGVPYDKVTKAQRQVGKGTNFSQVFGVGVKKFTGYVNGYLGDTEKLTEEQGAAYREKYHKRFTGPRKFMNQVIAAVSQDRPPWGHYVRGKFGRIRRLPSDKGYQGANFLCQNWGADLMKKTMVKLKEGVLKDIPLRQQIHDDLRVDKGDMTPSQRDEFVREVSRVMCDWPEFEVPIRTECKWSETNWAECKEYEFQKEVANAS